MGIVHKQTRGCIVFELFMGAFFLTNLNLDSSIENWIRLLTSWNIKSESGSIFTRKSLGQGYLETFGQMDQMFDLVHVIKQSRMQLINQTERTNPKPPI